MDIFNPDFIDFIQSFNNHRVEYMLVGGYAVVLRGYSRSTGDMDIWVNKTEDNFYKIQAAFHEFGLPAAAISKEKFFSSEFDVFSFGKPPFAIEILTALKGIPTFDEAYTMATYENEGSTQVKVIHLKHLLAAKHAAGRHKDLNDIENLPSPD